MRVKVAIHFFFFLALPNAIDPSAFIPKSMRNEFRALKCLMFCFINHSSTHIENKFNLWLPKPYKLLIQALVTNATQSIWCQSSWITIYCMSILKMHKKKLSTTLMKVKEIAKTVAASASLKKWLQPNWICHLHIKRFFKFCQFIYFSLFSYLLTYRTNHFYPFNSHKTSNRKLFDTNVYLMFQ